MGAKEHSASVHLAQEEEGTKRGEGGGDITDFGEIDGLGGSTDSFPGSEKRNKFIDGIDRTRQRPEFV